MMPSAQLIQLDFEHGTRSGATFMPLRFSEQSSRRCKMRGGSTNTNSVVRSPGDPAEAVAVGNVSGNKLSPQSSTAKPVMTGNFYAATQKSGAACSSRSTSSFLAYIHRFYAECSTLRPAADVRLVVDTLKREVKNENSQQSVKSHDESRQVSQAVSFFVNRNFPREAVQDLLHRYSIYAVVREERVAFDSNLQVENAEKPVDNCTNDLAADSTAADACEQYDHVVLGGTFDHLHDGHKMMLTQAVLLARKTLTIGLVIDSALLHKELGDLIQSFEERKLILANFLRDIDPGVQYNIYPLQDKFGPSTVLPELQALVVSAETLSNSELVNAERSRKSLAKLEIVCVDLVNAAELGVPNAADVRLSSTRARHDVLGRLLRPQNVPSSTENGDKFIIGLTGGSCSGKSKISSYLIEKGLTVIDCDKLGHAAYGKNTTLYEKMIEFYGESIVDAGIGEINRAALGKLVFAGDKGGIEQLNQLVWPEIQRMAREHIRSAPTKVVVLDAAVLIEAGWSNLCNEVWVAFVPRQEALRRIQERDKKSLEEAEKRLNVQLSNRERIQHAHRVFCSLWKYDYTHSQVDRALDDLQHVL